MFGYFLSVFVVYLILAAITKVVEKLGLFNNALKNQNGEDIFLLHVVLLVLSACWIFIVPVGIGIAAVWGLNKLLGKVIDYFLNKRKGDSKDVK